MGWLTGPRGRNEFSRGSLQYENAFMQKKHLTIVDAQVVLVNGGSNSVAENGRTTPARCCQLRAASELSRWLPPMNQLDFDSCVRLL